MRRSADEVDIWSSISGALKSEQDDVVKKDIKEAVVRRLLKNRALVKSNH